MFAALAAMIPMQSAHATGDDDAALRSALHHYGSFVAPRFQLETPCPGASGVMIDQYGTGFGLASQTAKSHQWQARILWIDATANIDRYNSAEKISALAQRIADTGFNTVVLDVKPISGQTIYRSRLAPKLEEWRGHKLPLEFDPLPVMVAQCHSHGLTLFASLNAFSEGHRLFKVGPGYQKPEHQTLLYKPRPILRAGTASWPLSATPGKPTEGAITVEPSPSWPTAVGDVSQVLISPSGRVEAVPGSWPMGIEVPKRDTLLEGAGKAGEFIRSHLSVGTTVTFDTEPAYVRIGDEPGGQVPLMMDPNDPAVRQYALDIVREVVSNYDVDGIIYDDRLRYAGLDGDFSEISRSKFEAFLGRKLSWPDDVFKFTIDGKLHQGVRPGPWYDVWLAWRAQQIRNFVVAVRRTVKEVRSTAQMGVYVGSWYGDYPALGHNYASPGASPGFWFTTPTYASTGTSPLMDFLIGGCYYDVPTIYDAMSGGQGMGTNVEAAGTLCNRLVRGTTWTYAGIDCGPFAHDPEHLEKVVQAACASTQGVMVFDLSHDMDLLWPTFARLFRQPRKAPHQVPGAVTQLRKQQAQYDAYHIPEPPIIISAGASGIGQ